MPIRVQIQTLARDLIQFVETPTFTRYIVKQLSDDRYRELQEALMKNPHKGSLIKRTGGARKVRWSAKGRGKSGGSRIIYFYAESEGKCYMLVAYGKNEKDSLTDSQKNALRKVIKRNLK